MALETHLATEVRWSILSSALRAARHDEPERSEVARLVVKYRHDQGREG